MARHAPASPPGLLEMARTWDRLARTDPMHFVATSQRRWSPEAFFESGRGVVEWVLRWLGPDHRRHRILEIGCGLGRTVVHFARAFERVDGIDISETMIRAAASRRMPPNVHLTAGSGSDLRPYGDGGFDLVFSTMVFQHIPSDEVVACYLREVARVLHESGTAILQFDTRRRDLIGRACASLPDALLPATHRRHVRRYRRDPAALRRMIRSAGLDVSDERGSGTAVHYVRLRRAAADDAERPGLPGWPRR
jgi:SAM-dependent methyltransferase